jgi:hypothetical protein
MFKKIILGVIFAVIAGALVWGGIIRTSAKNNQETGAGFRGNEQEEKLASNHESIQDRERQSANGFESAGENQYGNNRLNETQPQNPADHQGQNNNQNPGSETGRGGQNRGNGGRGVGNGGGGSQVPLNETEIEALQLALDDEYNALSTYLSVIDSFGEVEPFLSIAASEQRHIEALVNQFNKYGIPVPANPYAGMTTNFESLSQACQAGVDAENINSALYDRLFAMTDRPDLVRVFTNLQNASLNSHLPEFESCN